MIKRLLCRLFGHSYIPFLPEVGLEETTTGQVFVSSMLLSGRCVRCGVGIKFYEHKIDLPILTAVRDDA